MLLAPFVRTITSVPATQSFFTPLLSLLGCLALLIASPQTSKAADATPTSIIVPFVDNQGLILIRGKVGKQTGHFILDTGANGLVLNDAHFSSYNSAGKRAYGLQGGIAVGRLSLPSFTLGPLRFGATAAQVIDLRRIEDRTQHKLLGLIGYRVLEAYEITLDYRMQEIIFTPLDAVGNPLVPVAHAAKKVDSLGFSLAKFLPVITVRIDGQARRMGIDTGAEYNLLEVEVAKRLGSNFQQTGSVKLYSSDGRINTQQAGKLARLVLGKRYKCGRMGTLLVDFQYFDKIYQTQLDGILGKEFLAPWIFSINYRKQLLYIHEMRFVPPVAGNEVTAAN
ncbi:MAG: pepsin/retropepsin-like aspartic protease family protein [Bacteroidota bacterium]